MASGANTFSLVFKQVFTDVDDRLKQGLADTFTPIYQDVLGSLQCAASCAAVDDRIAAIQSAIDEMAPWVSVPPST